jgi:crossover junction endodeoxyribonuclease RuvC
MIILGIDPGTATVGYGLIEIDNSINVLNYGIIQTSPKLKAHERLKDIYDDMNSIIKNYNPDILAIEELFFFKNLKTIITVSQARGVILLSAQNFGLEIAEYTPLQVKLNLSGYGRASKSEIQILVKDFLNLDSIPKPDDAADALAIAICHYHNMRI